MSWHKSSICQYALTSIDANNLQTEIERQNNGEKWLTNLMFQVWLYGLH